MEIRQLRYFIAVADTLNFSRAAESVFLSQSALSRQIADLEKEVGVSLFRRSTRQVELTEAGKALQHGAKELISRWEKMIPEVRNQVAENVRALTLTIGVDSRAPARPDRRKKLVKLLYEMRREFPGLRIIIRNYDYQELIKGLVDHSIDGALVLDRELEQRADIQQETFATEEMVLVFRSPNPHKEGEHSEIISKRGLILVDKEHQGLYHIIRILGNLNLEPQIRFCETLDDMTMMVETGESASILPESVVMKLNNPDLQVLHLPSDFVKLHLSLLWAKNQNNPMLDIFRKRLEALLKE